MRRDVSVRIYLVTFVTGAAFAAPPLKAEPAAAVAEECKSPTKKEARCKEVEVVVTGTRSAESEHRATVRTDAVTREEAERRGATNVAEALAGETTLQINPENYDYLGRPSGAQIQGLDAERVLVLEDGERVLGDSGGVIDLAGLPLSGVERIEYVAGPTSSLYGSNALGGVINVIRGPPRTEGPSVRYRAEGRSRGHVFGEASGAHRVRDTWAALDASFQHRKGIPVDDERPELLVPGWTSSLLAARAGFRPARALKLALNARWSRDRSQGLDSQEVPGLGTYLLDLPNTSDRFGVRVKEDIQLGKGVTLDLSLAKGWYINEERRDRRDSPVDEVRRRSVENQNLEAVLSAVDGPTRTWVLGVRSESEQFRQRLRRTLPDLSEERLREVEPMQLASGAIFGQLAWRPRDAITLMPGFRAELHDRYGAVFVPRLATAWRVIPALTLRAAGGRGFRGPSAKEFGFFFDHSALGYRVVGNQSLRPETSWGLTLDVTWRAKAWRLRAGTFHNWVDDLIVTTLAREQSASGVTDYTYLNVARARTAGADISARAQLAERVTLDAGYAYLWTRDDTNGEALPGRPAHTLTLAAHAELPAKLLATVRYRRVSSAFIAAGAEGRLDSPAFGLLDARLGFRLSPALELFSGVLNALDERREPARLGDTRPALGRSFYAGLRGELTTED